MQRILPAFVVLALCALAAPGSCTERPTVTSAAADASAIFVGKISKITRGKLAIGVLSSEPEGGRWGKELREVDVVTFEVSESLKPKRVATLEIVIDTNAFVGYGGTSFHKEQTYLVYAFKRRHAGSIPKALPDFLRSVYKGYPRALAKEIDLFNKNISPYGSSICSRTTSVNGTEVELELLRLLLSKK